MTTLLPSIIWLLKVKHWGDQFLLKQKRADIARSMEFKTFASSEIGFFALQEPLLTIFPTLSPEIKPSAARAKFVVMGN